ncbi:hypothetical protein AZL_a05150 (plasmid) [Azospirillum sp. B510]|nr:hypothetical protein AZL_a05150 [Azospirillum sp. B510]
MFAEGILDDPAIEVTRFTEVSGLSRLTDLMLTLATPNLGSINADLLLGRAIEIVVETPHAEELNIVMRQGAAPAGGAVPGRRTLYGIVTEITDAARASGASMIYELRVQPRVAKLAHQSGMHLHADSSVPDTLAAVLTRAGFQRDLDFVFRLTGNYPKRSFALQFNESDLDFLTRLAEHWGIGFFFEHAEGRDILVFTDGDPLWKRGAVPVLPFNGAGEKLGITEIRSRRTRLPSRYVLRDYNADTPDADWSRAITLDGGDGTQIVEYAANFESLDEAALLLKARSDALTAAERLFTGVCAEAVIDAGTLIQIDGHPGMDGLWLAVTLVECDYTRPLGGGQGEDRMIVRFTAALSGRNVRPERRTPKPRMDGLLAGVIEPESDPTYAKLDEQGRYKVRLLIDDPAENPAPFARVRMAQPHGGQGYGVHLPLRPGTEVVLAFLNGDPDRPVIAGVVPNARLVSPIDQSNNTSNVIRTGGGNQIAFEDEADGERIRLSTPHKDSSIRMGAPDYPDSGIVMQTKASLHAYPAYGMNVVAPFAAVSGDYVHLSGRKNSVLAGASPFSSAARGAKPDLHVLGVEGMAADVTQGLNEFQTIQSDQQAKTDKAREALEEARLAFEAARDAAATVTGTREEEAAGLTSEELALFDDPGSPVTYPLYTEALVALQTAIDSADVTTGTAVDAAKAAAAGLDGQAQAQGIIQRQTAMLAQLESEGASRMAVMDDYRRVKGADATVFLAEREAAYAYAEAAAGVMEALADQAAIDHETLRAAHREALDARRMPSNLPDGVFPPDVIETYRQAGQRLLRAAIDLVPDTVVPKSAEIAAAKTAYGAAGEALLAAVPPRRVGATGSLAAEINAAEMFVDAKLSWAEAGARAARARTDADSTRRTFEQARGKRRTDAPVTRFPPSLQGSYDTFVEASDTVLSSSDSSDARDSMLVSQALAAMDTLAPVFPSGDNALPFIIAAEVMHYSGVLSTAFQYERARLKLQRMELDRRATADALQALDRFQAGTADPSASTSDMMRALQEAAIALERLRDLSRNAAWAAAAEGVETLAQHSGATRSSLSGEAGGSVFTRGGKTSFLELGSDNSVHLRAGERILQSAGMIAITANGDEGTGKDRRKRRMDERRDERRDECRDERRAGMRNGTGRSGKDDDTVPITEAVGQGPDSAPPAAAAGTVLVSGGARVVLSSQGQVEAAAPTVTIGSDSLNAVATKSVSLGCAADTDAAKTAGIEITPNSITFTVGDTTISMTESGITLSADSIALNGDGAVSLASGGVIVLTSLSTQIIAALDVSTMATNISSMGVICETLAVSVDTMAAVNASTLAPFVTIN